MAAIEGVILLLDPQDEGDRQVLLVQNQAKHDMETQLAAARERFRAAKPASVRKCELLRTVEELQSKLAGNEEKLRLAQAEAERYRGFVAAQSDKLAKAQQELRQIALQEAAVLATDADGTVTGTLSAEAMLRAHVGKAVAELRTFLRSNVPETSQPSSAEDREEARLDASVLAARRQLDLYHLNRASSLAAGRDSRESNASDLGRPDPRATTVSPAPDLLLEPSKDTGRRRRSQSPRGKQMALASYILKLVRRRPHVC